MTMDKFLPITISLMIIFLGSIVGAITYSLWASDQLTSDKKRECLRDSLCIISVGLLALIVSVLI